MLAALLLGIGLSASSFAAPGSFDHFTTGFELLGMHRDVPCADCHVGGLFKGTPHECVACHAPGARVGASAKPTNHILSNSDCSQCHTPFGWKPVANFNHLNVFGTCSSCHNTVQAIGKPQNHVPTTAECNACHLVTQPWTKLNYPNNHIPTSPTAQCTDCHNTSDFSVVPSLTNIHLYAPSTSSNCAQCHGSSASFYSIPAIGFTITAMPPTHIPTTAPCESCHVGAGSSIAATPVVDGQKFTGSAMNHAGLTTCVSCHGPTVTGATFYGIATIITMPATAPMGLGAHIPSGTACESCHLATMPSGLVPGNATKTVPGSGFENPAPTTTQIHAGITSGCATCHEGADNWVDMTAIYPLNPATLTASQVQYMGFQTRPGPAASATNILDKAHPATGDCSNCHSRIDYFEGQIKPSNHIPTAPSATCANCHTSADFSVMPALVDIHTYAPSTTTNCTQCHGSTTAPTFAIPAANFSIVTTPSNHVPTTAACESCHVGAASSVTATPVPNGATFKNSAFSHAGVTTCVGCHGPTITATSFYGISNIIVMPATSPMGVNAHIPSATACETCHLASMPSGQIAGNATKTVPGSGFENPAPTTAMIHAGITSNCASCHEGANNWLDMTASYPLNPASYTGNISTQYMGFQTRPGKAASATNVLDGAHPTSGDCSGCHSRTDYFEAGIKPSNHIPTSATATCGNCHTGSDFSVMPTLANIHLYAPSTTANCTQCHGSTTAPTFAIPAANFSIVTTPANHIPTTASCEVCHVGAGSSIAATPVPNGATFKNSAMSHSGLTTCVSCHGPTITGASFVGITKIVVMPATSPMGVNAHVPSATTCETCHLGSMPAAFVPANATATAPGTAFATPAPTTAMIHGGIATGCASCHEANYLWMDVNKYPISPTAVTGNTSTQYVGFQTRPQAAATTYSVADSQHPATGDCSNCHSGTDYFSAQAEPANHIPTLPGAPCATCHTTAGNFAVYTSDLTALHTQVPTTCSTCHADGKGPFAGVTGFAIVQMSTRGLHIPITNVGVPVECSGCHKSVTTFTGTIMSHAAIGDTGTSATGDACDACHEFGYRSKFYGISINWTRDSANHHICGAVGTPTAPDVTACSGGGSDCLQGCHQHDNQIPSKYASKRPGTPQQQLKSATTPAAAAAASQAAPTRAPRIGGGRLLAVGKVDHSALGATCQSCHNGTAAAGKGPAHPATTAACGDCHSTLAWQPVLRIDHADVLGTCVGCHNGSAATGKPAAHIASANDCDRCHTTSAWKPAAFDHATVVPGTCATCHNGLQAPGKPANHVVTARACDSCHYVLGWTPVKPANAPATAKPTLRPTPTPRTRAPQVPAPPQ